MTPNEYQHLAMRTNGTTTLDAQLLNGGLGIAGEAGEVADLIKKWVFHEHGYDPERLMQELGDVLWYIAQLCDALDLSMEDVMEKNIAKLQARYPEGFSAEASRNRIREAS